MNARILIVDDSLTVRKDLEEAFLEAGFASILCADLDAARRTLKATATDLAVLDVLLPDGDGVDFLREIRENPATTNLPVLLLSTEAEVGDRVRGLVGGANGYIGKPYDRANVIDRARELLRQSSAVAHGRSTPLILLIEDSATCREELTSALETFGYAVRAAVTGEEGLQLAARMRPDLVVVDGQLPGIDGITVVHRLRTDIALRRIPCLLLTAASDKESELKALEAGADNFVCKDESTAVVLGRISAILRSAVAPTVLESDVVHGGPKRILAVDDSQTFLEAVSQKLRSEAFEVIQAQSGEEALRILSIEQVDCVLLDLMMPGMSGEEACRRIKSTAGTRNVPVLILTAHKDQVAVLSCLKAGADDYIPKAAEFDVLIGRIRAQLRRKQYEGENRLIQEVIETVRKSDARFRSAFEHTNVAMMLTDIDNRIIRVNHSFAELFGYPADEMVGVSMNDLTSADDFAASRRHRDALLAGEANHFQTEIRYLRKDNQLFWCLTNVSLVRTSDGIPLQYVGQLQDVTERRQIEEQLRQSQKMEAIGHLAGGVAHDFNNLLTVITGYSEMLLHELPHEDQSYDRILEIKKAADRAASLTRQLLAFSRKQILAPQIVDLNSIVIEAEKMFRRLIGEDIQLVVTMQPKLWAIKADPGQMEQVILNLVVNSRDAMPRGGTLTIETRNVELDLHYTIVHPQATAGPHVLLAVTDTGCGMDQATLGHIFEPFFTTKEVGKGTGLGLATVYGIVKQSGGSIDVSSEVGHGATFKIYLPRVTQAIESSEPNIANKRTPTGFETVLLVEDEAGVRSLVRTVLQSNGYKVLEAQDGQEALELLQQQRPGSIDLLLTDVVMPGMGGRQLADLVVTAQPSIKVLYLSGYTDAAVVRHGAIGHNTALLQKPFTPLVLARKVREVLDR